MTRTSEESPTSKEQYLLDTVARKIVERGLSAPAVIFLESTKPLNVVGCQALNFLEPFIQSVFSITNYNEFIKLMENRSNIEELILKIETLEEEKGKQRETKRKSKK